MTRISKLGGAAVCGAMLLSLLPATSEGGLFRRLGCGSHGGYGSHGGHGSHGGLRNHGCGSHGGYSNGCGSHGGYGNRNGNGSHGGYASNGCGSHGGYSNGSHEASSGEQRVEYHGDYNRNETRVAPEPPPSSDDRVNQQDQNIEDRPQGEAQNQDDNVEAPPVPPATTTPDAAATPPANPAPPQ